MNRGVYGTKALWTHGLALGQGPEARYHWDPIMTIAPKAALSLNLTWQGGERFSGPLNNGVSMMVDGTGQAAPSPVQAVAFALASCMAIDVVDIIEKGRVKVEAFSCDLDVFRAEAVPKRIIGFDLKFKVKGDVPPDRVARAIDLSREKYCSVWHSLDPTIDFKTSFTVTP